MAELVFIATIIFVAYVVFVVLGDDKKDSIEPAKPQEVKVEAVEPSVVQPAEKAAPAPAAVKSTPASTVVKSVAKSPRSKVANAKSTAAKAAAPAAAPAPTASVVVDTLKNPKTGEVAKVPNSYAFAKRWIKDALVEEGLLDKVYKNNELNDEVSAKIQAALQQLKAIAKYQ